MPASPPMLVEAPGCLADPMGSPNAVPCSGLHVWTMGRKKRRLPESRDRKETPTGRQNCSQAWRPNSARRYPVPISLQRQVGDLRKTAELRGEGREDSHRCQNDWSFCHPNLRKFSVFPWTGCILTPILLHPQRQCFKVWISSHWVII